MIEDQLDLSGTRGRSKRKGLEIGCDIAEKIEMPERNHWLSGEILSDDKLIGVVAYLIRRSAGRVDQSIGRFDTVGFARAVWNNDVKDSGDFEGAVHLETGAASRINIGFNDSELTDERVLGSYRDDRDRIVAVHQQFAGRFAKRASDDIA